MTLGLGICGKVPARHPTTQRLSAVVLVSALLAGCTGAGPSVTPAIAPSPPVAGSPGASSADVVPDVEPSPSASPSGSPAASQSATPDPSPSPPAKPVPFNMDVYRSMAFATQPNLLYCVPGASVIIVNLVAGRRIVDESAMAEMYAYGQSLAVYENEGPGVDPAAWAGLLDRWGAHGYAWHAYPSLGAALHHAALRIRLTGRPVGLTVGIHKGHAWVIAGFRATADPADGPFTVTAVAVTGSLWPMQQYYLGYFDMPPDSWITPAKLQPAVRPFRASIPTRWDGMFVTVEP